MSVNVAVNLDLANQATEQVSRLARDLRPDALARTLRAPLETHWRQHLAVFPRLPGRFASFPSTGYGERAARAVRGSVTGATLTLGCYVQGIRQRYFGGTIRPVNKRALCFGITPESYGKTPYDFGLGFISRKDPALRAQLKRLFIFTRKVTQRPNPAVIPDRDQLMEVAMAAVVRSAGKGAA